MKQFKTYASKGRIKILQINSTVHVGRGILNHIGTVIIEGASIIVNNLSSFDGREYVMIK